MCFALANTTESLKQAADWSDLKEGSWSKKTQESWHHSIDKEYNYVYVKFEVGSLIPYTRKDMPKKSGNFFMGMTGPFQAAEFKMQLAAKLRTISW